MKAMENTHHGSYWGMVITLSLWLWSKFLFFINAGTLAELASVATIISAAVVAIANSPKAWRVIKNILQKKN